MFSNLIIGLVELEHKDEKIGCKKISVGVYRLRNTYKEGHGFNFISKKKCCINKCIWKNDEKERKRIRRRGRKKKGRIRD